MKLGHHVAPPTKAPGNRNGYVLESTEDGDDHAVETLISNPMLVAAVGGEDAEPTRSTRSGPSA